MDKMTPSPIRLDDFWAYQVVVLADRVSRYTLDIVKTEAGLNQSQWRVLAAIADRPGRSSAEVAAVTPLDKTLVSRAVASLLDAGFIKRTPSPKDKRSAALDMTDLGQSRYDLIAKRLTDTLTAETINGQSVDDFNASVKHFGAYVKTISSSYKP